MNAFEKIGREGAARLGIDYEAAASQPYSPVSYDEGDYLNEDGLITCGVCGMPKECSVQGASGTVKFPIVHQHQIDDMVADAVAEAKRSKQEQSRIECFRDMPMGINYRSTGMAADTDKSAVAKISRFTADFAECRARGRGLLVNGTVGVGKTFLACAICNSVIDRGYTARMTSTSRLMAQMGYASTDKVLKGLRGYDLVVLDDFGAERSTEAARQQVFDIVDSLYMSGTPMVVTTNLATEYIENPSSEDARSIDRIRERCQLVTLKGSNRRQMSFEQ